MKQGNAIPNLIVFFLFCAALIYFGVSLFRGMAAPLRTLPAQKDVVEDILPATGFFVRTETVVNGMGELLDVLPSEGEKLGQGQTLAVLYRDTSALDRKQEIRALELEAERLEYALRRGETPGGAAKLNETILSAAVSIRALSQNNDFSKLEDASRTLKNLMSRRSIAFAREEDAASAELAAQRTAKRLKELRAQAGRDTIAIRTEKAGVFSGVVDGYEEILTVDKLGTLTPSYLAALSLNPPSADLDAVGKMITSSRWYFAATIAEADAKRLTEGRLITVRFLKDYAGEISMLVERINPPEAGSVVVVFSSSRFLSETTLLRKQTVEIIFDRYEGFRVPKSAIRVGADGTPGLFTAMGLQAEYKPVLIVSEMPDFFLVRPLDDRKTSIRQGEEIICSATDLFDGKVVR